MASPAVRDGRAARESIPKVLVAHSPAWGAPAAGPLEEPPPWRADAGALAWFKAESGWGWDLAMMQVKDKWTGNDWVGR